MAAAKKPKTKRKPPDPKAKPAKRNRRGKATGVVADALDEEFAILYLTNGRNATAACRAMRPDLTVASTYQQAGEWLRKPVVQRIIKEHTQKIIDDHRHELNTLVTELAQIGMFDTVRPPQRGQLPRPPCALLAPRLAPIVRLLS